jgi:glycosyltransferase involved in cell wall biosynthesis
MALAIHQVLPTFAARDAIGHHALRLRELLRDNGFVSEIVAGSSQHDVRHEARSLDELNTLGGPNTRWLYHASIGWPKLSALLARPEPLATDYHNITPHEVFGAWEPHVGSELRLGRSQLVSLARKASMHLADSAFNAAELRDLGARNVHVAPILLDDDAFAAPADAQRVAKLTAAKRGAVWLFVGRIAPHKAQHDLVSALAMARRRDENVTLRLVGASSSHLYESTLHRHIEALGLSAAVTFVSGVSHGELLAEYDAADVFVSASDHEGFCVPLIEAMHRRLPVVAFASTAVPETLGSGGLLLADKSPVALACAIERVLRDRELAASLVAAGTQRVLAYRADTVAQIHLDALSTWASASARHSATGGQAVPPDQKVS